MSADSTGGEWRLVGASVRGVSHERRALPCQDAHRIARLDDGTLLVAVADGAGSASRAEEGATHAVAAAIAWMSEAAAAALPCETGAWEQWLASAFAAARKRLDQWASEQEERVDACATTLLCAVLHQEGLAAAQVGDGALVVRGMDGTLVTALLPQRGEYANETRFLTSPRALDHLTVQVLAEPVQGCALLTDGLRNLALAQPGDQPHPAFFGPLFQFCAQADCESTAREALSTFLESPRVCARTDDDKTLVLLHRVPSPAP